MYRYYSTQRPVMPGTYPAEKKVSEIVNFSERKYVTNISREAWGWIEFEELLTEKEEKDYELVRELSELERLRTLLGNAVDSIVEHESVDSGRFDSMEKFWRYLFDELGTDREELRKVGIDLEGYF